MYGYIAQSAVFPYILLAPPYKAFVYPSPQPAQGAQSMSMGFHCGKRPPFNMASKKTRVYWNDSKKIVWQKLGLEDNEDFSKFEVGPDLLLVLCPRTDVD